jgi:nucleotidyltransferase substrate binding protein (TIGR01987 family)
MERLATRIEVARRALATLSEAVRLAAPSVLERDGTIQRFEYTFEACWKACQAFLEDAEGLRQASPKGSFRAAGRAGLLDPAEVVIALRMVDDRNRTVHVYLETVAQEIHARLAEYAALLAALLARMDARLAPMSGS